jgi:hypothetical protein
VDVAPELMLVVVVVVDAVRKPKLMLVVDLALELMPVVVAGPRESHPRRQVRKTRSRAIAGVDVRPTVNRRRP